MREGMGRLERRDDAFEARAELEGVQGLVIANGHIFDAPAVVQPRMFGANARIVQSGRNRMGVENLPVVILQQIGAVAVEYARGGRLSVRLRVRRFRCRVLRLRRR